jgi:hypothetical protein
MGTGQHEGRCRRWVAGMLGGALLLGALGARAVPSPPPLLKVDPHRAAAIAKAATSKGPEAVPAKAEEEPGAGPAVIWLLPMAGQLSSSGE